jgi:hypothetical protein
MAPRTLFESGSNERSEDVRVFCRSINERIVEYAGGAESVNLVCECPHPGCFVNVRLPVSDFRLILGGSLAYVVAPGHVDETTIVRREPGYHVVLAPEVARTPYEDLVTRLGHHEAPLQHPPVG